MGDMIKNNPHWIAIISIIVTLIIAISSFCVGYGGIDKQVEINTDTIQILSSELRGLPSRTEFDKMQKDVTDIRNYLLGEKKN